MRLTLKATGFTLVELLVSISILTLISTATVFTLRSTRETDELNTSAQILAGDLRNIQARALAAHNVKTCDTIDGKQICEPENPLSDLCAKLCEPLPPMTFGIHFKISESAYDLFAEIDPLIQDWRLTNKREILLERNLNPLGGDQIVVSNLQLDGKDVLTADLAVHRQNGVMRIEACGEVGLPACGSSESSELTITLRHQHSGTLRFIEVNALSGRIFIHE
jgi:prepilin-type N-terminal cleavage/methylation domain-containing protein